MIVRYGIANVSADTLAKAGQNAGLEGSITTGIGFGQWGIEPATFVEFAARREDLFKLDFFIVTILALYGEQAAYRVVGTLPTLLYDDGRVELL